MTKNIFITYFILILSLNTVFPQWGLLRRIGVGGGVHFGILNPALQGLNSEFKKYNLPEFITPLFGFGGGGNLTIGGIRIGGFGISGGSKLETKRITNTGLLNTRTKLEYSTGFGTIGYEIYHSKKFSANLDLGIGGGKLNLYIIDQNTDYDSWSETLGAPYNSSNISRKVTYSFFSIQPSINIEYIYGNFLKFFLTGDYNFIINGSWEKDDSFSIIDAPKLNFDGFVIRFGTYLGLYF